MSENIRELQQDEYLFKEGDAADCAYIVESGELEISTHSEGEPVIICTLRDGDIVGEMGIIDNEPRTASALALVPTRLTPVTQNQLTDRIAGADAILKLLIQILLDRYRTGLNKVKGGRAVNENAFSEEMVREYIHQGMDKIRLEVELKYALAEGQLKIFYQPLLNISNRKIAGFEALTRWIHPERGFISPALFIFLAEGTDLIVPVGLYVFEQACQGMATFEAITRAHDYPEPLFMSINVSGRQIADPSFIGEAA